MGLKIKAEIYSRVVGYFRPVNNWNRGKKEEFSERSKMKLPENLVSEPDEVKV